MRPWQKALMYILIVVILAYFMFPLYVLFLYAFTNPHYTFFRSYPYLYPVRLTLKNLLEAAAPSLSGPAIKSLVVATLVGLITLALALPTAYGLSKINPLISYMVIVLLFITNLMPSIVIAIPIASTFVRLGLYNSDIGLALAQTLITLPMAAFILLGTFQSIPPELEWQARIDGASLLKAFYKVLMPLAAPSIAAVYMLSWLFSWDEFTFAVLLSPISPTLPVEIYISVDRGNLLAALALSFVLTIPAIVLVVLMQRYLRAEYLAGGLKG